MTLQNLRDEIDKIDTELVDLFLRRMNIAEQVAKEKKADGLPVLNSQREKEVLDRVSNQSGEDLACYTRVLYNTIFDLSRSYQNRFIE